LTTPHHHHPRPRRSEWGAPQGEGQALGRFVLVGIPGGDPPPAVRRVLAQARVVAAPRVLLAAHRGLVPADALVEVLPDSALDDPGGVRVDLPEQGEDLVVLFPAGRPLHVLAAALKADVGADRVAMVDPDG
jgi:hypothetical protein